MTKAEYIEQIRDLMRNMQAECVEELTPFKSGVLKQMIDLLDMLQ